VAQPRYALDKLKLPMKTASMGRRVRGYILNVKLGGRELRLR